MPYGEHTLEWFSRFKRGENSIRDSERSGRPSTSRADKSVEEISKTVKDDK